MRKEHTYLLAELGISHADELFIFGKWKIACETNITRHTTKEKGLKMTQERCKVKEPGQASIHSL
jgi:hypothetical protein